MMDRATMLRHLDALEPLRESFRYVLLEEPLRPDATMITLHRYRAATQMRQHDWRNRLVIRGKFAFRDPFTGKQNLFRMSDHLALDRLPRVDADDEVSRGRSIQ